MPQVDLPRKVVVSSHPSVSTQSVGDSSSRSSSSTCAASPVSLSTDSLPAQYSVLPSPILPDSPTDPKQRMSKLSVGQSLKSPPETDAHSQTDSSDSDSASSSLTDPDSVDHFSSQTPRRTMSPVSDPSISTHPPSASSIMRRPGRASVLISNGSVSSAWANLSDISDPSSECQQQLLEARLARIEELNQNIRESEAKRAALEKHVNALHIQLDQSSKDHRMFEERIHEQDEQLEEMENERKRLTRRCREYETIYEGEQVSLLKEKEQAKEREARLLGIIDQLKVSLSQKDGSRLRSESANSTETQEGSSSSISYNSSNGSAPPRTPSSSASSALVLQKDRLIESLRLELAEAQNRLVEMEGGGRLQALEKELQEARMTNARLMEDNESYQLLLSERTLNGDFSNADVLRVPFSGHGARSVTNGSVDGSTRPLSSSDGRFDDLAYLSSLADELEPLESENGESTVEEKGVAQGGESSHPTELHTEIARLQETNKALSLYISEILERILSHQSYEEILTSKSSKSVQKPASNIQGSDDATSIVSDSASTLSGVNSTPAPITGTIGIKNGLTKPPLAATRIAGFGKGISHSTNQVGSISVSPAPRQERPQSIIEKTKAAIFPSPASPVTSRKPRPLSICEDPATAPKIPINRVASSRLPVTAEVPRGVNGSLDGMVMSSRSPSSTGPNSNFASQRHSIFGQVSSTVPGRRLSVGRRNLSWSGNGAELGPGSREASIDGSSMNSPSRSVSDASSTHNSLHSAGLPRSNTGSKISGGGIRTLQLVQSAEPKKKSNWLTSFLGY